jgi:hypothetical protein
MRVAVLLLMAAAAGCSPGEVREAPASAAPTVNADAIEKGLAPGTDGAYRLAIPLSNLTALDAAGMRMAATIEDDLDAVKFYDVLLRAREAAAIRYGEKSDAERKEYERQAVVTSFQTIDAHFASQNGVFELAYRPKSDRPASR